ncbi:hypothetical protein PMAYCL1PPCAC_06361, partial [Pristionchus mayeri]
FKIGAHIDHIENLDEQAESVDVHGAVHFKWTNPHYSWNTSIYRIDRISRFVGDFYPWQPWTPRPQFRHAVHLGIKGFQNSREFETFQNEEASQLTIDSNGSIALSVPFSLRVPCNFRFLSFPHDEHICTLRMQTEYALKSVVFERDDSIVDV